MKKLSGLFSYFTQSPQTLQQKLFDHIEEGIRPVIYARAGIAIPYGQTAQEYLGKAWELIEAEQAKGNDVFSLRNDRGETPFLFALRCLHVSGVVGSNVSRRNDTIDFVRYLAEKTPFPATENPAGENAAVMLGDMGLDFYDLEEKLFRQGQNPVAAYPAAVQRVVSSSRGFEYKKDIIRDAVSKGVDIDEAGQDRNSALLAAVRRRDWPMTDFLVHEMGAVAGLDRALSYAVHDDSAYGDRTWDIYTHPELLKILLKKDGIDWNQTDPKTGKNVLLMLVEEMVGGFYKYTPDEYTQIIDAMCRQGADPAQPDNTGQTALSALDQKIARYTQPIDGAKKPWWQKEYEPYVPALKLMREKLGEFASAPPPAMPAVISQTLPELRP